MMNWLKKHLTHPYIASAKYDWGYFLFTPVLAALIGGTLFGIFESAKFTMGTYALLYLGTFITNFHLILVFYRSHNNPQIFKTYIWRFTLVPVLLALALFLSEPFFYFAVVLALLWDSYHSAMQIFGIGRIYDMKLKNNPQTGRSLDFVLNLVIHYIPMILGLATQEHLNKLLVTDSAISPISKEWVNSIFPYIDASKTGLIAFMIGFIIFYVYRYKKLTNEGYRVSINKAILLILTLICRLYVFQLHFFSAWIALNVFHAIQYFGIVWFYERDRIQGLYGASSKIAWWFFLISATFYALYVSGASSLVGIKVALLISLLHYWYDGFIWSVRKKQL